MGIGYADRDKDSFWDLDLLLPQRKKASPMQPFASSVRTAEVGDAADASPSVSREELRLTTPPADENAETSEYTPPSNRLLLRVRITRRRSEYNFYGQFCRDAEKYLGVEGEVCPFAPFFSYIPQYSQLTQEQRAYYFYWRSALRRGEYLQTEESYFYLYVYEIINLPHLIRPEDGIVMLCKAWQAYRDRFPRIDKYMTEWVCDYCLVHGLSCPQELVRPFLTKILPFAGLREFYLGGICDFTPSGVETALAFFSDYRWQDSRYAEPHRALYETHIARAVAPVLERLFADSKLFQRAARSRKAHDAFCGSLCAHNIKCRIEAEYYALNDIASVREGATAAVKYAENKLRALLAVKSRLAVPPLDEGLRAMIDAYFARMGERIVPQAVQARPAYEKLYDAPTKGIDFARAASIEQQSWDTVKILVPEEEQHAAPSPFFTETKPKNEADRALLTDPAPDNAQLLTAAEGQYLSFLLKGDRAGVRSLLASLSAMEEELAEAINEKAAERLGDIVLEPCEEGYRLIEDYTEEVSLWIP